MFEIAYNGLRTYTTSLDTAVSVVARLRREGIMASYRLTNTTDWQ